MLRWLVTILVCGSSMGVWAQGAQADQIKRRARTLAEENNARQGVPPSSSAPRPTSPSALPPVTAPVVAPASPQAKALAPLRASLAALAATNSPDTRREFIQSLRALARQPERASESVWRQLSEDLAAGLSGAKLSSATIESLATHLQTIVHSTPTGSALDATLGEVQPLLTKAGATTQRAALVSGDLRRLATALQAAAAPKP